MRPRSLGRFFGLVAAGLLVVAALVTAVIGVTSFLLTHNTRAGINETSRAVIEFVVGMLVLFFSLVGGRLIPSYTLAAGVVLVVLALVGWLLLGFGGDLLSLFGALFALIAGILLIVDRV